MGCPKIYFASIIVQGVMNVAGVCLDIGYPTITSVPHSVVNGFKNLLAVAAATDITFKEAETVKAYLADPSKFVAAVVPTGGGDGSGGGAGTGSSAPAEAKKEPEKSDSDSDADGMGLDLFG